jgi:predicted nucleic acid-binding protein
MRSNATRTMPEIVFDTCVISNFALAGALGILEELYRDKARITDVVSLEILRGIQSGHARLESIPKAIRAGWLKEVRLKIGRERALFESLSVSLGLGEASSLAAAKGRGLVFASDDRMARAEAAKLGVTLTGALGIMLKAVRGGACGAREADEYLVEMIDAGFFSPARSLRELR